MPYPLIVATPAQRQIDELKRYISRKTSAETASRYIGRLLRRFEGLAFAPEQGTLRDDISPGLRITGFEWRVTIAFRFDGSKVEVVAVAYAGRLLKVR